jgi:hypothetical protein
LRRSVGALASIEFVDGAVAIVIVPIAGVESARVNVVAGIVAIEATAGGREEAIKVRVAGR